MGAMLKRACRVFGCPNAEPPECPDHGRKATQRQRDKWRGTSASRGYSSSGRWGQWRQWWIGEMHRLEVPRAGLCGARLTGAPETTHSRCASEQAIVIGSVLNHIVPVTGPNDPTFYDPLAVEWLCASCNAALPERRGGPIDV